MDMRCYLPGIEEPNPVTYGNCIKSPSYVSNWLTIESQTSNSEIYIAHTCQDDPIKVEAQVKSQASSPYSDYVFNGINSALRDDDSGRTYGGVIVLYNASHVRLVAPKGANDGTAGSVIYTGGSNWHGPYDRTENVADVRVKVWCAADFKTPSFESTWIKINSTGPHFHEISHNLGEEIQLVTVQIKHESSSWIVGGIGSSSATTYSHYDNYGGVIYGYSNDNVRLWLPKSAPVFDMSDGWGLPSSDYTRWFSGSVKVRLWTKADLGFAMEKISIGTSNILNTVILPDHADLNNDFVYVSTFVNSGNNQGFSFPADSSVQESEAGTTFGSVVYAHSSSRLFVWQPIHTGGGAGYLVYIGNRWGETSYEQYSNTGTLQVSVIKTANQCKA